MPDKPSREPARDPQDLERLLVSRQHAGDVEGMAALFEADAVIDSSDGRLTRGRAAIEAFFAEQVAAGRKFQIGEQRPALVNGSLPERPERSKGGRTIQRVGSV
jgi:hypothetical protein